MTKKRKTPHASVENRLKAVLKVMNDGESVASVAHDLGVHRDTVNRWVIAYKENGREGLINPRSITQSPVTEDQKRIRDLEKQVREQKETIEILKKFEAFLKNQK
ncbi:transposase [Falsibacillus pallidus]|uniref:transposase n=1 Tax=Falsibacillus pallidus TaxID=493781 RepID=UPI003D98D481